MDLGTEADTENIECTLSHTKDKLKRMRSTARSDDLVEFMWRPNFSPSGPALRRSQTSSDTSASSSRSNCCFYLIWTFQFDLFQLVAHFNTMIMPCVRQMLLIFLLLFQCGFVGSLPSLLCKLNMSCDESDCAEANQFHVVSVRRHSCWVRGCTRTLA